MPSNHHAGLRQLDSRGQGNLSWCGQKVINVNGRNREVQILPLRERERRDTNHLTVLIDYRTSAASRRDWGSDLIVRVGLIPPNSTDNTCRNRSLKPPRVA